METFDAFGNKVEILDNGSARVTRADGTEVTLRADGGVHLHVTDIKKIGIDNLIELRSYVIIREGDNNVHAIEFNDGGKVRIAYTNQGQLLEFTGNHVRYALSAEKEVTISSYTAAAAEDAKKKSLDQSSP